MSRNKRNWDHLVDEAGNYKASGSPNETHQAFCSFDGDNASNFFGGFNIDRVERVSRGEYNIYFKVPFPHKWYNVIVSANSGFRRNHHVNAHADRVVLKIRNANNETVDDSFITFNSFLAL